MSMEGEYDSSNAFAKILRNELPSVTVFEDDDVLVFDGYFSSVYWTHVGDTKIGVRP